MTSCLLLGLQLGQLITVALADAKTTVSLAAAALNFVAAFLIVALCDIEHAKTIRPSFLLSAYLFTSVLFDVARARTQWLMSSNIPFASLLSASLALKTTLLILENVSKRTILIGPAPSHESTSGPFNRGLFVWLNSLLVSGWATVLTSNSLPAIYEKLSSEALLNRFESGWSKGASVRSQRFTIRPAANPHQLAANKQTRRRSLFLRTIVILKWELLGIALPRLVIVALTISQPFLITSALRFLSMPPTPSNMNLGYGLIGAFAFVYIGSAVSLST